MSVHKDLVMVVCDWCNIEQVCYRDDFHDDVKYWKYAVQGDIQKMQPITRWYQIVDTGLEHMCPTCQAAKGIW